MRTGLVIGFGVFTESVIGQIIDNILDPGLFIANLLDNNESIDKIPGNGWIELW